MVQFIINPGAIELVPGSFFVRRVVERWCMFKFVKYTATGAGMLTGSVIGGAAIARWIARTWSLDLLEVPAAIVDLYSQLVFIVFFWTPDWVPEWVHDWIALYTVIGFSIARFYHFGMVLAEDDEDGITQKEKFLDALSIAITWPFMASSLSLSLFDYLLVRPGVNPSPENPKWHETRALAILALWMYGSIFLTFLFGYLLLEWESFQSIYLP